MLEENLDTLSFEKKQEEWNKWIPHHKAWLSQHVKYQISDEKSITIDRIKGISMNLCANTNFPKYPCFQEILLPYGDFLVDIEIKGDLTQFLTFNQILSTFKFLE